MADREAAMRKETMIKKLEKAGISMDGIDFQGAAQSSSRSIAWNGMGMVRATKEKRRRWSTRWRTRSAGKWIIGLNLEER
jgi:hypothetical protein